MDTERLAELDRWFPPAGPCAFCGHPDKRHRLWDAILERYYDGESAEELAKDYEVPVVAIRMVWQLQPYADALTGAGEGP